MELGNMDRRFIALLLVLLIIPFTGCFGNPVSQPEGSKDPKYAVKIVPYVDETHKYYSGSTYGSHNGWGSWDEAEATEDYFWLDIRRIMIP